MTRMSRAVETPCRGAVWQSLAFAATQAAPRRPRRLRNRRPRRRPSRPKIDVTGFVDVYYGYNFNKVDPDRAHLRRPAQHVLPEPGGDRASPRASRPESRSASASTSTSARRPTSSAAFEPESRRQGDLQAHRAGLREPAHGQGAVGRRQVRDADRRRGDRVAATTGTTRARSCSATRSRSTTRACAATWTATDKLSLAGYLVNGWNNISEINGDKTRGDRPHLEAEREVHLDRQRHVRQGDAGLQRHAQPVRHHPHLGGPGKLSLMAQLRLRHARATSAGGASPATPSPGEPELGSRRPLRVRGRHGRRLHDLRNQGADASRSRATTWSRAA